MYGVPLFAAMSAEPFHAVHPALFNRYWYRISLSVAPFIAGFVNVTRIAPSSGVACTFVGAPGVPKARCGADCGPG